MTLNKFSDEQLIQILTTKSTAEAVSLGIHKSKIYQYRKQFGLKTTHNYVSAARKFFLNEDYFKDIDSEEKAYILGFLAADGNVNPQKYGCEIRIVLHPKDVDILEKINTAWESTYIVRDHKLGIHSGFSGSSKLQKKLSVMSSKFQTDLAKYNIVPNKTLKLRYPSNLPKHLDRHFLRGFLDGDGYINHEAFGWTTNPGMANDIQRVCMEHGFEELKKYKVLNKETSYIVRGGPFYMPILKWMYADATIFLNRKHEQFNLFWRDRVYVKPCRPSYPSTKHIPCDLEALPPVPGSLP